MYPYLLQTFNVTRETKLATILYIDNTKRAGKVIPIDQLDQIPEPSVPDEQRHLIKHFDVNAFCSDALYVDSNAIAVGKYFNLPSFDEVDRYMQQNHPELCVM